MQHSLHNLSAPLRTVLFNYVLEKSQFVRDRLKESQLIDRHLSAALTIIRFGKKWRDKKIQERKLKKIFQPKLITSASQEDGAIWDDEYGYN